MTIGDVLAVIAAVGLLGVSGGAALLLAALAFPARTQRAADVLAAAPGRCLLRGLGLLLLTAFVTLALGPHAEGPARLLKIILWSLLLLAAVPGGAGIVRLLGERIRGVGTRMTPFAALTRGAALCVLAGLMPVVGWLLITPLSLMLSLGAMLSTIRPDPVLQPESLPTGAALTPSEALS